MSLEENSSEALDGRCRECGAKLTSAEMQAALESGAPALCSVHADEVVPLGEEEEGFEG